MHGDRCLRCGVQADVGHHVVENPGCSRDSGHDRRRQHDQSILHAVPDLQHALHHA